MKLGDLIDKTFPPGSPERAKYDSETIKWNKKQDRLDKLFGWMKSIPPHFPPDKDNDGYDHNYWKSLGRLMFLVWRTLADEGFYGMLDMLSFHYFDDRYVLTFKDIRRNRFYANKYKNEKDGIQP